MALNGIAPIIIFNFYKELPVPSFLQGFIDTVKIPLIPIPIYLDENLTKIMVDDYDRDITIDVMRDGVSGFEKVSGDVVSLKFHADKSNIALTVITAFINLIVKSNVEKRTYSITFFYDNIFIIGASLENFSSRLIDGTTKREISIKISNRPSKPILGDTPLANTAGSALGF
jgi:hypothetical protein